MPKTFRCVHCGVDIVINGKEFEDLNGSLYCENCNYEFGLLDIASGPYYETFEERMKNVEDFIRKVYAPIFEEK